MDLDRFSNIVEQALKTIPKPYERYFDDIVVLVEERPEPWLMEEMGLLHDDELMGLYQGDTILASLDAWGNLPDSILLFKNAIELYAEETGESVHKVIRDTLLHELGHHLGLDEDELARMGLE